MKPKPALRSIKDVHSRLKWDGGIPTESIFIGYIDRMRGLVEMPFSDFTPGGRVPWDRIQYFRLAEQRIWDRETRTDLIFGSGDTPPNMQIEFQAQEGLIGSGWQRISALKWDALAGTWEAAKTAQPLRQAAWNTLTLNILSNHFLHEKTQGSPRYQQLLDLLSTFGADLITLQEADREFLELLLQQPWVQRNYCVIDNRHIAQERSHFEIVLTLLTPQIAMAPIIDEECRSILVGFEHKGSRFWVLNLHLFSDTSANAFVKREEHLLRLLSQLPAEETVLIQGDFNFGDEHESPALAEFTDFWLQLHPGEAGIT
ncbi:MAG TPA: RNA repair domain-containing protein, partial [Bacteroidia bacterium]|nr:RNA repair domain-containing protein [Bacteroidia bacterium]